MAPDRYTELFFLDEATGLAAGHRPCFECRRKAYNAYAEAWAIGNSCDLEARRPTAALIDERLHAERTCDDGSKRTYRAAIGGLPDGVFLSRDEHEDNAFLLWEGQLLAWTSGGYSKRLRVPKGENVSVLTPRSTVAAIQAGYLPEVHPSVKQ